MKKSLKTLLGSKRTLVAILGVVSIVATHVLTHHLGLEASEAQDLSDKMTTSILGLAGVLIASIGVSDHGRAMGNPAGVGHKDGQSE
jgi:uncharacterized membrane protein